MVVTHLPRNGGSPKVGRRLPLSRHSRRNARLLALYIDSGRRRARAARYLPRFFFFFLGDGGLPLIALSYGGAASRELSGRQRVREEQWGEGRKRDEAITRSMSRLPQ